MLHRPLSFFLLKNLLTPRICIRQRAVHQRASSARTEHLYGASCVLAALQPGGKKLQAGHRKLRKLYVKDRGSGFGVIREDRKAAADGSGTLVARAIELARQREVAVVEVPASRLDALSDGRPNQGMVLAASPMDALQIRHLGHVDTELGDRISYPAVVTKRESFPISFSKRGGTRPFPIWLAIDQVVDPQNLGAVLRSAHFFDIDGVVLTEHETAPFSPTVSKASAGAMEAMELFVTGSLPKFLEESAEHGWHIYGTDIHSDRTILLSSYLRAKNQGAQGIPPLVHSPTILVLGSEGRGLRSPVSKMCHDHLIVGDDAEDSEDANRNSNEYRVDSLNVSVAAGILLHALVAS
ncbi:Alpha/beta knot methyltransferase [Powellomyces hirtus]|nr:Alpha/beta knot methyltransferase [Powellomyces hirtus]